VHKLDFLVVIYYARVCFEVVGIQDVQAFG
jgi:hypothetical protein